MKRQKKTKRISEENEISVKTDPFKRIQIIFENNIFLHEVSIKEIGRHAKDYDNSTLKELKEILLKKIKKTKKKSFLSDKELNVILSTFKKHPKQSLLFSKNTLVSLVSTLDVLFSKLFTFYYRRFPEKLSLDNQSIRYSELKNIDKIEDAQNILISREIESLLFQKGLSDRLNILNKEIGIDIKIIDNQIQDLKKVIKIRNLIVHNQGLMDKDFVNKYGDKGAKINNSIKITYEYLTESLYLVYFIGTYILQEAQLHLSEKIETEDFLLNNLLHTLIKNNQYNYIKPIYNFAQNHKMDENNKKLIVINYCIGLKKQGKEIDHIQKVLELEDWSVKKEEFEMCKDALLGKIDNFYSRLKKLIKSKIITKDEIDEWIIFSLFKEEPKFKNIIKNIN